MSEELIQRVLKVIAASKRIPLETVTIDSEFQALNIDSMDAVEILFALENEFDINIPDDQVRSVRTVRQMCEGVERLVVAKAGATPGSYRMRRVAITGIGSISAIGRTVPEFAESLRTGRCVIEPIESCDMSNCCFQNGAEVKGYSHH